MRSGRASIVTSPLVPVTVTGNAAVASPVEPAPPVDPAGGSEQATSPNASAIASRMPRGLPIRPPSDRKALGWVLFEPPTNRPSVEDRRLRGGGGDPTRPRRASRLRDSAGFQPVFAAPRRTRAPAPGHRSSTTGGR